MTALVTIDLPLPLLRRGKVREVFEVDVDRLLLVASDRVSAFDVVMDEPIPRKGAVLTQLSAWWFRQLAGRQPSHFLTSDVGEIVREVSALAGNEDSLAGRSMLVRRTRPVPFECVVRGYIAGSAWREYSEAGTLAGEPLPEGLRESDKLEPPLFSPATKAETGHDENVRFAQLEKVLGEGAAAELRDASLGIYSSGRDTAASRGIIVADTKFEFGHDSEGKLLLIDEVLTPDSSRFWPADRYQPGRTQPSFDKQPLRDWLHAERSAGRWNGESPGPALPPDVVQATSDRYLDAYRRLTGHELPEDR